MGRSYVTYESEFCKQITLQKVQSEQFTNLMHKFLFYNKFIIFLCMFRAQQYSKRVEQEFVN